MIPDPGIMAGWLSLGLLIAITFAAASEFRRALVVGEGQDEEGGRHPVAEAKPGCRLSQRAAIERLQYVRQLRDRIGLRGDGVDIPWCLGHGWGGCHGFGLRRRHLGAAIEGDLADGFIGAGFRLPLQNCGIGLTAVHRPVSLL